MALVQAQPKPAVKDNTMITQIYDEDKNEVVPFDVNRIIFCNAVEEKVPQPPESKEPPLIGHRIKMRVMNPDMSVGDLVFETEPSLSFGIQESRDRVSGALTGYSLPVCIWNKEGPTAGQLYMSQLSDEILNYIKEYLVRPDVRTTIADPTLEKGDLKKMKLFYWKIDKSTGLRIPGRGPVAYPKLIISKKKGFRIMSRFFLMDSIDEEGNPIELDPVKLMKKWGIVRARFKFDSIYRSSNGQISIQIKLWEADFKPMETGLSRIGRISATASVYDPSSHSSAVALLLARREEARQQSPQQTTAESAEEGRPNAAPAISSNFEQNPGVVNPLAPPVGVKK